MKAVGSSPTAFTTFGCDQVQIICSGAILSNDSTNLCSAHRDSNAVGFAAEDKNYFFGLLAMIWSLILS